MEPISATSEGGGEVAVSSAKSWDRRIKEDLIEYVTPCQDAPVAGLALRLNPVHLNILDAKSEDCTNAP